MCYNYLFVSTISLRLTLPPTSVSFIVNGVSTSLIIYIPEEEIPICFGMTETKAKVSQLYLQS